MQTFWALKQVVIYVGLQFVASMVGYLINDELKSSGRKWLFPIRVRVPASAYMYCKRTQLLYLW